MHGVASLLAQYGAVVSKFVPGPAKPRVLGNETLNLSALLVMMINQFIPGVVLRSAIC